MGRGLRPRGSGKVLRDLCRLSKATQLTPPAPDFSSWQGGTRRALAPWCTSEVLVTIVGTQRDGLGLGTDLPAAGGVWSEGCLLWRMSLLSRERAGTLFHHLGMCTQQEQGPLGTDQVRVTR